MKVSKVTEQPPIDDDQPLGESPDALNSLGGQMPTIANDYSSKTVGTDVLKIVQADASRARCKHELRWRLARAEYFGTDFFTDPAWDVLLLLYSEEVRSGEMASSEFDRLGLPRTTIERWLEALDQRGLIRSSRDDANGLIRRVSLTERTRETLFNYFAALSSE